MPFVIDTGAGQFISGMKRQLIIDTANRRTGGVGEKLNLSAEFLIALQEFCLERQWWWRRKTVTLDTIQGINVYDMSDPESPVNALDCVRIIKCQFFPTPGQIPIMPTIVGQPSKLVVDVPPIFSDADIQIAMEDEISTGFPVNYFLVPGSSTAIEIVPIPDQSYHLRFNFWACPNGTIDTLADMIPLVPAHLQHLLIPRMEISILSAPVILAMPGMGAALQVSQNNYLAQLARASTQRDFADGHVREFIDRDVAIRSER